MNKINYRSKALEGMAFSIATDNIGIYPQTVQGGENPYVKRTERMEGWNDCVMEITKHACMIKKWLSELPAEHKSIIEDFLLNNTIDLHISDDQIEMSVNCNDLFFWGCSDCEELTINDLPDLQKAVDDSKNAGSDCGELLWVARKRQMRPQGAYYAHVSPNLGKLFDACGEFRPAEIGNPVPSSFEEGERYRQKRANQE